ncbi:MAG TPA: 5-deoxy-glucuronate isomerase, partial [Polyangiaceae bacterium]|nr:5-deoxy-glucuronate isomerase [Polyangiaceae bacterium]
MAMTSLDSKQLIFSGTASKKGRHLAVTPANSSLAHLAYGRIRLDTEVPRAAFETGGRETAMICMKGSCRLTVNGTPHDIGTHDGVYIPRGSSVEVTTAGEVDLVECSADVTGDYPFQIVRY